MRVVVHVHRADFALRLRDLSTTAAESRRRCDVGKYDGSLDVVADDESKSHRLHDVRGDPLLVCRACLAPVEHKGHHIRDLLPDFDGVRTLGFFHHRRDELVKVVLIYLFETYPVRVSEDEVGDACVDPGGYLFRHLLLRANDRQAKDVLPVRLLLGVFVCCDFWRRISPNRRRLRDRQDLHVRLSDGGVGFEARKFVQVLADKPLHPIRCVFEVLVLEHPRNFFGESDGVVVFVAADAVLGELVRLHGHLDSLGGFRADLKERRIVHG